MRIRTYKEARYGCAGMCIACVLNTDEDKRDGLKVEEAACEIRCRLCTVQMGDDVRCWWTGANVC